LTCILPNFTILPFYHFTILPLILRFASLPGFADGDQQTELNLALPSNG